MNRAESGVGDSVPFFVRIGEKVRATFYARIYEALLCPAEYPFASSTRSKRTHIANAGSAGLSAPVKSLIFAAMRCRDGLATLSALKSRSLSIRHKGALGVRGLLRDASIYRPSNRREAEREAANRFAGIRPHAAQRSVSRRCERCHVGQSPALPSPRLDPTPSGPSSTARRYARGEQRDRVPRRSASAYRPSRCGEGRVPRVPPPAVTACGCTVQRTLPRARPVYIHGRAQSARTPPGCKGTATRPRALSEPRMCAECEDDAEREIVLDTARVGAYYSILRQARKRLSESRGAIPAGGNLENRILDRRNHFLLSI